MTPATVHRLASADGFSLEVPDGLQEVPEREGGPVCLVAQAEPWSFPETFRPNLTAEVTSLAPDRSTMPQLSALTIAAQLTLGVHVAACDVWQEPGVADGRRITSVYPAMGTTVVQQQYVAIRGGRAICVSLQCGADRLPYTDLVFRHAVASIQCDFDEPVPEPDPDTMPRLDPFAAGRGLELEYLGGVRAAQPFVSAGPALEDAQIDALRRGKVKRGVDPSGLEAGGFVDAGGRLTEMGEAARAALRSPLREVQIEVTSDDGNRSAVLRAYQGRAATAVVATAPPGQSGDGCSVDVIPSETTPVALARWLGLAPAWAFGLLDEGDSPSLELDGAVLDARLAGTDAPPPGHASAALARVWGQPWQVARLGTVRADASIATVISTSESGTFRLERDRSGTASLTPLPSATYLRELLELGGFGVAG